MRTKMRMQRRKKKKEKTLWLRREKAEISHVFSIMCLSLVEKRT